MNPKSHIAKMFYTYGLTFLALAPTANASQTMSIQAGTDFQLTKLSFMADIALANTTESSRVLPNVTCLITDTKSGRQLMNEAVPIVSLFGTGGLPFVLPSPVVFSEKSNITVALTSYSAATTYNIRLAFHGINFIR